MCLLTLEKAWSFLQVSLEKRERMKEKRSRKTASQIELDRYIIDDL